MTQGRRMCAPVLALLVVGLALPAVAQDTQAAPAAETPAAPAAKPVDTGIENIVITITKREESVQEIGGTVAAFGEKTIEQANIENVGDLIGLLPNVQVKSEDTDISVRGVARAAFDSQSPVAFHVNGIYQFNSLSYIGQFYDLQNVAIALGPSGTVYGRNANGGAIDLTWRKPHGDWEVIGDSTWAPEFDNYQFRTAVNVPLSGVGNNLLNARFALIREVQDGNLPNEVDAKRNSFGAKDDWTARGFLRSEPLENLTLELRSRYHKGDRRYAGGVSLLPDGTVPVGVLPLPFCAGGRCPFDWASGFTQFKQAYSIGLFGFVLPDAILEPLLLNGAGPLPPFVHDASYFNALSAAEFEAGQKSAFSRLFELGSGELEIWDVDGSLEWNLSGLPLLGDVDAFFLGGFSRIENEGLSDSDATSRRALDTISGQHPEDKSTFEFRFQSNNESWLNWTLGFFYVRNHIFQMRNTFTPLPGSSGATLDQEEVGYAPFANVTLRPIDPIEIFLGVRWNHDEFNRSEDPNPTVFDPLAPPFLDLENTFRETTLDAGIKWFITDEHMVYAKWARGYKAGFTQVLPAQPDPGGGPPFPARPLVVKPEVILATEIGLKTSWLDGRLQLNTSAFHYDYTNLQIPIIQFTQILNINAEEATVWGLEIGVDASPIENWNTRIAVGWLRAEFDDACANDPLVNLTSTPQPPDPACAAKQVGLNAQERNIVGDSDLSGRRLEDSPEWKVSVLSTYRWELGSLGTLSPTLEFTWTDEAFRRPFNNPDIDIVDAYTKTDARLRWAEPENRYWVEVFGENLENEYVYPRGIVVALTGTAQGFGLLQPRTYGVRVGFNWGGGG